MRSRTASSSLQPTTLDPTTTTSPPTPPPPPNPNDLLNPVRPSIRGRLESSVKKLSTTITEDILSKIQAMHHYRSGRTRQGKVDPITGTSALPPSSAAQLASQPPPPSPTRRQRSGSRPKSSRRLSRFGSFHEAGVQLPAFLEQKTAEIQKRFHELDSMQNFRKHSGDPKFTIDESPAARKRNRFTNIHPWEGNRIHLKVPSDAFDYINASPIELTSADGTKKKWIATQGPITGQFHLFWRMLWQEVEHTAIIIMLTPFTDNDYRFADKCGRYFPETKPGGPPMIVRDEESGDDWEVKLTVEDYQEDATVKCYRRKIIMTHGYEQKTVWHFQYENWPDHGVLKDTAGKRALIQLIHKANSLNPDPTNPIFVHCAAGVGRSGTYIALDHFIGEISKGLMPMSSDPDLDPIFDTINQLREQRMYMVQSQEQLKFVYRVLAEQWTQYNAPPTPSMPPLTSQHSNYNSQNSQGSTTAVAGSQDASYRNSTMANYPPTPRTPNASQPIPSPINAYFTGSRRPGLRSGESFLGRDV